MVSLKNKHIPLMLKLSVMISLLVIGGISVVSVAMLTKQSELQDEQVTDLGQAMARQLAISTTEPVFTEDSQSLQLMVNNFVELPRIQAAAVLDKKMQVLAMEGRPGPGRSMQGLLDQLREQQLNTVSQARHDGLLQVASSIRFRDTVGGYVFIVVRTESLFAPYARILELVLLVSGLVAIGGFIVAYYISRHISRPINQLLDATTRFGEGSFDTKIEDRRNDELGRLIEAINAMGDGLFRKNQVENLLGRFLAKDVADQVLERLDTVRVGGEKVEATVLFVDIVGFTGMSEKLTPEQVAELLNEYFSYFTICSSKYFGTIDKFIGDCAMVIFGAPKKSEHHQFNAVACAVLMQKLNRTINARRSRQQLPEVQLRIGINSGQMLAGVLGNQQRMEYTVVGDSVNLASRLCSEASPDEIVVSQDLYDGLVAKKRTPQARVHRSIRVRGKEESVNTYLVDDVAKEYQLSMDDLIDDVINSKAAP